MNTETKALCLYKDTLRLVLEDMQAALVEIVEEPVEDRESQHMRYSTMEWAIENTESRIYKLDQLLDNLTEQSLSL